MTDADHRALAAKLQGVQGKVALSGYRSALYTELYADWYATEGETKIVHSVKQERTEILWTNYEPKAVLKKALKLEKPQEPKGKKWNRMKSSIPLFDSP